MHVDVGQIPSPKKLLRERVRAGFRTPERCGLVEASQGRLEGHCPGHCAFPFDGSEIDERQPLIAARKPAPGPILTMQGSGRTGDGTSAIPISFADVMRRNGQVGAICAVASTGIIQGVAGG
jgi:hypothetical protein